MDRSVNRRDKSGKALKSALVVLLALLLAAGTTLAYYFGYQQGPSVKQGAGMDSAGGRILDYFTYDTSDPDNPIHDKNVAAMSYASEAGEGHNLYARIKLTEYMEQGAGAGNPATDASTLTHIPAAATLGDTSKYQPITLDYATDSNFGSLRNLAFGNGKSMKFIPTLNRDASSTEVDLRTNTMVQDDVAPYLGGYGWASSDGPYTLSDYYSQDQLVVHQDGVTPDTGKIDNIQAANTLNGGTTSETVTDHFVKESATTTGIVSLADWNTLDPSQKLDKWVYCDDGYFYWSSPIAPEEASGLLLDDVEVTYKQKDWYYAINVEGDFVTPDEIQTAGDAADAKYYWSKSENKEISADVYNFLTGAYDVQWSKALQSAVFSKQLAADHATADRDANAASLDRSYFDENSLVNISYPARTAGDPGFSEDFYVLDEAYIGATTGTVYATEEDATNAGEEYAKARLVNAKYLTRTDDFDAYGTSPSGVWENAPMRTEWFNDKYLNSILPSPLKNMVPQVHLKTYKTGGNPADDGGEDASYSFTDDRIFLLSAADFTDDVTLYRSQGYLPSAYSDCTSYREGIVPKAIVGGLKPDDVGSYWCVGRSTVSSNHLVDTHNDGAVFAAVGSTAQLIGDNGSDRSHRGVCPAFWITAN